MTDKASVTVGELKQHLQHLDDETEILIERGLSFNRLKRWGDNQVVLLFQEAPAFLDEEFKTKNPHIKAAFVSMESVEWDEAGMMGSVNIEINS